MLRRCYALKRVRVRRSERRFAPSIHPSLSRRCAGRKYVTSKKSRESACTFVKRIFDTSRVVRIGVVRSERIPLFPNLASVVSVTLENEKDLVIHTIDLLYTYIHAYTYAYMHAYMCVYVCTRIRYARICTYIYSCTHTGSRVRGRVYACVRGYICNYICILHEPLVLW